MPQSQPQQTDYQGYARNYNNRQNQNQNPLLSQVEPEQQIFYNRDENPFILDDVSALTESDYGNDLLSSFNPKYAQVYPSSIRSADTIPENDLNRQVLFNEEKENDEMPFLNLQELKNTQPQQSFTEETPSKFYESPDIFNQEEEGLRIEESSQETTVIPNLLESFNRKEHMEIIDARHEEKFEEKKGKNPETYARKAREAELKNSIKEIKKEIDRLNEIKPEFMLSGDARKLNTLETQYANYQSELKYGSPELAVSQIQDILNEIVYGENPSGKERTNKYRENSYLKKDDMIKLNMLRALNGKRHHAKPIPIEQAKQEIESLIKIIRKIKPSQKKEEPQNRRFGANISTIRGMKKDDDEELYMRDRSTKK